MSSIPTTSTRTADLIHPPMSLSISLSSAQSSPPIPTTVPAPLPITFPSPNPMPASIPTSLAANTCTDSPPIPITISSTPPITTSSTPLILHGESRDRASSRARNCAEIRRNNRSTLQRVIEKVANEVKQSIDKLEIDHPTRRLWYGAPRPRKALRAAMEQLAQYPPCPIATLSIDIQDQGFNERLVELMHGVLCNLLLPKLRTQIRKKQSKAKRLSGASAIPPPLGTIPEERP
ncbi:hypothetical protein SISSUDRAFT_1067525 [Sistotremastrum suecicum HHB10207 ss-3]|uniref:Uncharacterized protein n=1 Tax=Sistotremastrum suecicum HHB10207 ss-3 TaxID=1314776 RepID=A0A165X0N1_9AGAM|nr:hypothetical protein SISSUDRAFT_1067525 [Sistotremastrum suecicum HHB10207 ss-3]